MRFLTLKNLIPMWQQFVEEGFVRTAISAYVSGDMLRCLSNSSFVWLIANGAKPDDIFVGILLGLEIVDTPKRKRQLCALLLELDSRVRDTTSARPT